MGAFVLIKNNAHIEISNILKCYEKKGFSDPKIFDLDDYRLLLYSKIKINNKNYISNNRISIFATGTYIYKGTYGIDALKSIYDDFISGQIRKQSIIGDYFIIIRYKKEKFLITNPEKTYNIYYSKNHEIISSSFLAVIEGVQRKFSLNKEAITEILVTGSLIGPETIVQNIFRLESQNHIISSFKIHQFTPKVKGITGEINSQINLINSYMLGIKKFAEKYGLGIGITGGLDSRLLLASVIKNRIRYNLYTTWRKVKTSDSTIAQLISSKLNQELLSIPNKHILEMDEAEAKTLIIDNFWFNDGLIRMHQLWTETIKSRKYLLELAQHFQINSSGIGGEQYRNNERLYRASFNFNKWIKYEILRGKYYFFLKPKDLKVFIQRISNKIAAKQNIDPSNRISRLEIKRYYNEIYNVSNRTLRNNIENQLYYFLSPFSDYLISHNAYKALNNIGNGFKYEIEMINRQFPELLEVESNYGILKEGTEPRKSGFGFYAKKILPQTFYWYIYNLLKSNSQMINDFSAKFSFVNHWIENVQELRLPLNIEKLVSDRELNILILEVGYFIEHFKNRIRESVND